MGLDPIAPDMTLLLVMLHVGTMFAVIVYFWRSWKETYFASRSAFRINGLQVALAIAVTGAVGMVLLQVVKHVVAGNAQGFEIEQLFGNTRLIAAALGAAGLLIIVASRYAGTAAGEMILFSSVTQSPTQSARGSAWVRKPIFAQRCSARVRTIAGVWSTAARWPE